MIKTNLFKSSENREIVSAKDPFYLLEYKSNLNVNPSDAIQSYYMGKMHIRKRQVIARVYQDVGITLQAGAMQMMMGNLDMRSNIKSTGDFFKKFVSQKVTNESMMKPTYYGDGILVLEPTYKHIIFQDLSDWYGQMVIEDGMFLACQSTVDMSVVARSTISSAIAGGEGLFNLSLFGNGVVALESPVPKEELIVIDLENDVVKIDGNQAIAWSHSLDFTVETSSTSLINSIASSEGFVNTFKGSGRILVVPAGGNERNNMDAKSMG